MGEQAEQIKDGICPICGKGRFRDVGVHARQAHGVSVGDLKIQAGMFATDTVISEDARQRKREAALRNGLGVTIRPEKAVTP